MRRNSVKKSSMFKVQQEKNVYKKYLGQVQSCVTAQSYPNLLNSIKRTSEAIYNYCYDFSEQNAFNKGINYSCKTYGISFPTSNIVLIREWIPNAKEVYLLGDFNQFNQTSHIMKQSQDQQDIYQIQLDITKQHILDQCKIMLRIIDEAGKQYKMPPLSCKIRSDSHGYICQNMQLPAVKHSKKNQSILAYTIDLAKIPLSQALRFIEDNEQVLLSFNTIILRSLFENSAVIDRGVLTLQQMKYFREIVNKVKNQLSLKIIVEWSLEPGLLKFSQQNLVQKQLLKKQEDNPNLWHYDLSKQQVRALYLANLSYFLSIFQVDGYHFKRVDSFCKSEEGQIITKCLNIMNNRMHQNGFTLASCKKQVPGLNQPILQGGLGFTFTYNYNQNFLQCKNHMELKQKFEKILQSSNCVAINLDDLTIEHELNFLFAVLVSKKGIFCKGNLRKQISSLLVKTLNLRKQPQLFSHVTQIFKLGNFCSLVERGNTIALFNFGQEQSEQKIQDVHKMQIISCFSRREPVITQNTIKIQGKSCCIMEK